MDKRAASQHAYDGSSSSFERQVDELADAFESAWRDDSRPRIAEHLERAPNSLRKALLVELVAIDADRRRQRGEQPTTAQYRAELPELDGLDVDWPRLAGLAAGDDDAGITTDGPQPDDAQGTCDSDIPTAHTDVAAAPTHERDGQRASHGLDDLPGYDILDVIAGGGMGLVLRAHHRALQRTVALKVPLQEAVLSEAGRERFLREARSAAKLRHPNICPVYDVGEHRGRPYMALAFIEGQTLREWSKQQRPNAREAAQMIAKLARGVAYAHEHGVVHRDIKPANVILDAESGEPMLTDFGLAKEHGTTSDVEVTQSGQILGTPAYMAPEQAAGHSDAVGPASDVYALGAMLFDLLCQRPPHTGTTGEILSKLQRDAAPSPRQFARGLHRDLETICLKALMRDPRDRYHSAAALADDLERFAAGECILARPTPVLVKVWRQAIRHPVLSTTTLAMSMALVGLIVAAGGAYEQHQLAQLRGEFTELIDTFDGTDAQLAKADALAARLARGDEETLAAAHEQINARLEEQIRRELRVPRLEPGDVERLEQRIGRLAGRDPSRGAALSAALADRRAQWHEVLTMDGESFTRGRLLRAEVPGAVRLAVELDPSWADSPAPVVLRLSQSASGDRGYQVMLRPRLPSQSSEHGSSDRVPPRVLPELGGTYMLSISRNDERLRARALDVVAMLDKPLRIRAERRGDRIRAVVNDFEPLVVYDSFPIHDSDRVHVGLALDDDERVERVTVARRLMPPAPSPLEAADAHFAAGEIEQAMSLYEQQWMRRADATDDPVVQEARYKLGLCRLLLGREDEAAETFTTVWRQQGDRWPALAAMRLWLLRMEQGRHSEAQAMFEAIIAEFPLERLGPYLSEEIMRPLFEAYIADMRGINMLTVRPDPELLEQLEQLEHLQQALGEPPRLLLETRYLRTRAHQLHGQMDRALELIAEMLDEPPSYRHVATSFIMTVLLDDYATLRSLRGEAEQAMQRIDSLLNEPLFQPYAHLVHLRVLRARLHAELGDPDEAIAELHAYLEATDEARWRHLRFRSEAHLLLGWLLHDDDPDAAQETWRHGFDEIAAEMMGQNFHQSLGRALYTIVLGSLSGRLADEHVAMLIEEMIEGAMRGARSERAVGLIADSTLQPILTVMRPQILAVLRNLCQGERGREVARDEAFRRRPLNERLARFAQLGLYQMLVEQCFDDKPGPEQDRVLWHFAEYLWQQYRQGAFGRRHAIAMYGALQGWPRHMGWDWLAEQVSEETRASAAYIVGLRHLRLDRPTDARTYFNIAASAAPDESVLAHLIREQADGSP